MTNSQRRIISTLTFFIILAVSLIACGSQEATEPSPSPTSSPTSQPSPTHTTVPTSTPTATNTAIPEPTETTEPTSVPTPIATPTSASISVPLDEVVAIGNGGFSFQSPSDFLTNISESQAGITSEDDEIILFMLQNPADTKNSLQELLNNFVEAVAADLEEITPSDSYLYPIDDKGGLATDVTGILFGDEFDGRIVMIQPDETHVFATFGFAVNGRWENEGSPLFDAVLGSVSFSPENLPISDTSNDTPIEIDPDFPLPIPSGEPDAIWNGITIMSQAIAGEGDSAGYSFIVEETMDTVQRFYEAEMATLGWTQLGAGEGETGALLLIFQQDTAVASISILSVNDQLTYILLVK